MWLDAIALALLAYFVISGVMGGALVSFLRIFSLIGAYIASFVLGPILAPVIELALGVSRLPALLLAGTALFMLVFLVCNTGMWWAKRSRREAKDKEEKSPPAWDRIAGGAIGLVQGAIFALLVGVLANWVEAGRQNGALEGLPAGGETIGAASAIVLERTADAVLGEDARTARVAVHFAARPADAIADFEKIVRAPALVKLQSDSLFWSYIEYGSLEQALNQRSFLEITHDDALRTSMAELGMISPESAKNPTAFRKEARVLFKQLSPRIRMLRRDPALQELAQDPAVAEALHSGNTIALLSDPRFQEVAARIMAADPDAPSASDPDP